MKITEIEAFYLRIPDLDDTICDGTQDTLVVRVHTDEGISGVGEVDSVPLVAQAAIDAPPSHSIAAGLRHLLLGENPLEVERLWEKMIWGSRYFGLYGPAVHAMSGIDIALWDIIGKTVNKSVSEMLGGTFRKKIKAYASALMPETVKEAAALAERNAKQGYLAMKFGWGPIGRDQKFDEEQIRAIRSAVGDKIDIMIDAGQVWDLKQALKMSEIYERYNIYWLEEPLHPSDIQGYKALAERTSLRIAGGEQESGRNRFQWLLDEGKLDIIQPDLARCGGLTEGKKIAYLAYDRHKKVVPHAFKTGILVAASTHFAAAIPNGFLIEHTVSDSPLTRDLVEQKIEFKDGYVTVPDQAPGLGITLNEQVLKEYTVKATR